MSRLLLRKLAGLSRSLRIGGELLELLCARLWEMLA